MALTTAGRWRQQKINFSFLLTQQSVARDSPFKIAQWTTQIMQKSRERGLLISWREDSIVVPVDLESNIDYCGGAFGIFCWEEWLFAQHSLSSSNPFIGVALHTLG